jgi:hypothetical protein
MRSRRALGCLANESYPGACLPFTVCEGDRAARKATCPETLYRERWRGEGAVSGGN